LKRQYKITIHKNKPRGAVVNACTLDKGEDKGGGSGNDLEVNLDAVYQSLYKDQGTSWITGLSTNIRKKYLSFTGL